MKLTQYEQERLMIFSIAEISRRRWKRGLKLNYVEATAIICDEMLERARDGRWSLSELMDVGSRIITEEDVMEGTVALLPCIDLEELFPDGNKLISIPDPIRLERRSEGIPFEELISMNY